jgi:two-component sensor histidine kinase
MLRWSLRTRLVWTTAVALLPLLGLVVWMVHRDNEAERERRDASTAAVLDVATGRYRELMESSRRLLLAACADRDVQRSIDPAASAAELGRCESYMVGLMGNFPVEYSAAVVTDDEGLVRCSSARAAAGLKLADRDVFGMARDRDGVSIGKAMASRLTSKTVIPLATGLREGGRFRGMCAIGVSLKAMGERVAAPSSESAASVVLVDGTGTAISGEARSSLALPQPARLAVALSPGRASFSERGQNGGMYQYRVAPLGEVGLFAVVAIPAVSASERWLPLGLALAASLLVLAVVWFAADRWCVGPLSQIEQAARRLARGESAEPDNHPRSSPELLAVRQGVEEMAAAIASRESELRSGLEQRDHMLREIHHRVKNNLQMISSLLNLQASEIRSPRIRRYFGDAQNRVLTLSILHRHLYERSSWSLVDFQQFISDLVRQISVGRSGPDRTVPRYHIRAPIMAVGPDTAIPVGLIVTEAVSSALNHQFAGVAAPEIRIEAAELTDKRVELVIEDNGRGGTGDAIGPGRRTSFGFTLLRGLAMQLGGEAAILATPTGGTRVSVIFPMPEEPEANG